MMNFITDFISECGFEIMSVIATFIFGYLGLIAKRLATKWFDTKTKKDVVSTCVQAVEQIYKDLHGEEKLNKALELASQLLTSKNIVVTDEELKMIIEAAVGEFNDVFNSRKEVCK